MVIEKGGVVVRVPLSCVCGFQRMSRNPNRYGQNMSTLLGSITSLIMTATFLSLKRFVSGVTASGEIVLSMDDEPYISEPYYVFYLNPEMNTLKSVEIKGFGGNYFDYHGKAKYRRVKIFVEDLNFINMKTAFGDATTSITPPEDEERKPPISTSTSAKAHVEQVGRKFKSINKFDSLCLLDDE